MFGMYAEKQLEYLWTSKIVKWINDQLFQLYCDARQPTFASPPLYFFK